MGEYPLPANTWQIEVNGDGDDPRKIEVRAL
jgi:hypothetical protein